ncbi:DUF421 domain-containing protein [bacterium C-53]|nr:DUF421 domain-containing protein [Lachnospiraceae bacterium]NBI04090.1 DUF421 domain-containing protein [Lachnospiraceae bacterium]RKJ08721.1 DUF421 domain-containing protein [bacterium C-53]
MQEIFYVVCLSVGSIVVLFILTKLMGCRQMSELSMFDYINGITIGSIAAEMATSLEDNFLQPLTAMVVYAIASVALSFFCDKSVWFRRFIDGKPVILYDNDKLYKKNLSRAKIDINEFLAQCRINGYFDLSKIQTALLEPNGKISFLPKSTERPLNPADLNLNLPLESLSANLIIDGKVMEKNLLHSGKDIKWLENQIKGQGFNHIEDVLLATCDLQNNFHAFGTKKPVTIPDILD